MDCIYGIYIYHISLGIYIYIYLWEAGPNKRKWVTQREGLEVYRLATASDSLPALRSGECVRRWEVTAAGPPHRRGWSCRGLCLSHPWRTALQTVSHVSPFDPKAPPVLCPVAATRKATIFLGLCHLSTSWLLHSQWYRCSFLRFLITCVYVCRGAAGFMHESTGVWAFYVDQRHLSSQSEL